MLAKTEPLTELKEAEIDRKVELPPPAEEVLKPPRPKVSHLEYRTTQVVAPGGLVHTRKTATAKPGWRIKRVTYVYDEYGEPVGKFGGLTAWPWLTLGSTKLLGSVLARSWPTLGSVFFSSSFAFDGEPG